MTLSVIGKHRSTISSPEQLLEENCCTERKCLQKLLSISQMRRARENFCQEHSTYEKQRKFILNWLDNNQPSSGEFAYTISGINACWSAWTKVLGITRRRFFELKQDFFLGRRNEQHGASLTSREAPHTEAVLNFLDMYFTENCDYMPNSSVWHLTSSSCKADVFQEFTEHMETTNQPVCSETFFRKIWNERYSHVKIPKVRLQTVSWCTFFLNFWPLAHEIFLFKSIRLNLHKRCQPSLIITRSKVA